MALHDTRHNKLHRCEFESCFDGQRYFLRIVNVVWRTARCCAFSDQRGPPISATTYFEYSSDNVHSACAGLTTQTGNKPRPLDDTQLTVTKHLGLLVTHIDQHPLHKIGSKSYRRAETFHSSLMVQRQSWTWYRNSLKYESTVPCRLLAR